MPQAKLKAKVKVPKASQKKKIQRKIKGPKKGGRQIAPKKAKLVESNQLKKNLQTAINKKIERELVLQAGKNNLSLNLIANKEEETTEKTNNAGGSKETK